MDRTDLHKLVSEIPESEIPTARAFLDFLILRSSVDPIQKALDEAPYDDEEYSEDFLASLSQETEGDETLSHQQVKQRLGLA